tara:strand:- start:164 stop:349 length:186 start_codon:yes stop_codon:yes gene_type:complete
MSKDLVFEYNFDMEYQWNFEKWHRINSREKRIYKEKEYTTEEAFKVFNGIYPASKLISTGQ